MGTIHRKPHLVRSHPSEATRDLGVKQAG